MPSHLGRRHLAIAAAGCAALTVVALVDPSRHQLTPPCPLRALTGLDCPMCGATRATHALLGGDVGRAIDFNALYVVALPGLVALAASILLWGRRPSWLEGLWPTLMVGGVAVLFAVLRNLPMEPWAFLGSTPGAQ